MLNQKYFREEKYFFKDDFKEIFDNVTLVNHLLDEDIIKTQGNCFKFSFVGVLILDENVFYCYPKYIDDESNNLEDFKEILNVIKKFNKHKNNLFYENDELNDSQFNLLSLMLFFIEDYYENGIYTKTQEIFELNGNGEIDWNRTVNSNFPLIKNGKPYYVDLQTRYKQNDLVNYFRLLHKCIITECSNFLESKGLLELFDLTSIELSQKSLQDFGDREYIKRKLEKELNVEFNTHKRKLLKAMISYISRDNMANDAFLTMYGTNSYWAVWEEMCSKVLENNLDDTIGSLFKDALIDKSLSKTELQNIIDFPIMHLDSKEKNLSKLIPDLVIIKEKQLIILDAKYRNLNFNTVDNHLSLYDVNKQFLYHLAFCDLIKKQDINFKKNALLFPTNKNKVKNRGFIEFKMFSNIGLEKIQLIDLPAHEINECFLKGETKPISWLKLTDDNPNQGH